MTIDELIAKAKKTKKNKAKILKKVGERNEGETPLRIGRPVRKEQER